MNLVWNIGYDVADILGSDRNLRFYRIAVTKPIPIKVWVYRKLPLFSLQWLCNRNPDDTSHTLLRIILKPVPMVHGTVIDFLSGPLLRFCFAMYIFNVPKMSCTCNNGSAITECQFICLLCIIHFAFGYNVAWLSIFIENDITDLQVTHRCKSIRCCNWCI